MTLPSPLTSPYSFNVLQSEPAARPGKAVYPAVAQGSPAFVGGTIPVPNAPETCIGTVAVPCDLVKVAVMLPAATAVTVTTSKFCPASTSRSMLGNMLVVELTLNVCGNGPATIGPVMVTGNTAAGSEIRPAWPISCCSNSVALRTEVCISVRLATVPCVFIIWIKPDITMEDTSTKTASDVIVSMSVKPACPFLFMSLRILIVCTLLKRISLQRRQSGLRERGVPKRAANGDGDGDPFHGVRGVYVYRSNLPNAHILPTCRRTAS